MPLSRNIDNEVNAPRQMRDVIIWGCAAVIAATAAISSYVTQTGIEFDQIASSVFQNDRFDTDGPDTAGTRATENTSKTDNITTGSIRPTNLEQTRSAAKAPAASFGTTVAQRQPNADKIRRMDDDDQTPATPTVIVAKDAKIGDGPIGIDLGTGHSFSVLGRRYSALVNAVPTLFTELSPRAAIVEHETSIEAHLIAGPLKDLKAAQLLCDKIQLRVNTTCQPTNFSGRKLKLY